MMMKPTKMPMTDITYDALPRSLAALMAGGPPLDSLRRAYTLLHCTIKEHRQCQQGYTILSQRIDRFTHAGYFGIQQLIELICILTSFLYTNMLDFISFLCYFFIFFITNFSIWMVTDVYKKVVRCVVAEKPHDAAVQFDTYAYRNLQRHRAVLHAIAPHLVFWWAPSSP